MNTQKDDACEYWGEEPGQVFVLRIKCPDLSRPNGEGLDDGYLIFLYG